MPRRLSGRLVHPGTLIKVLSRVIVQFGVIEGVGDGRGFKAVPVGVATADWWWVGVTFGDEQLLIAESTALTISPMDTVPD